MGKAGGYCSYHEEIHPYGHYCAWTPDAMLFHKQQYDAIAGALHRIVERWGLEAVRMMATESVMWDTVNELTEVFKRDNSNFSPEQFWEAVYRGHD